MIKMIIKQKEINNVLLFIFSYFIVKKYQIKTKLLFPYSDSDVHYILLKYRRPMYC